MKKPGLLLLLLTCTPGERTAAQKVLLKNDTLYRDQVAYCRMTRAGNNSFSPRFTFRTLKGQEFAVAQKNPSEAGYLFYFTALDTLVPVRVQGGAAQALAEMVALNDILSDGMPTHRSLRRFLALEAIRPTASRPATTGTNRAPEKGAKTSAPARKEEPLLKPAAPKPKAPFVVAQQEIRKDGKLMGKYERNRKAGKGLHSLVIRRPDGQPLVEAVMPSFDPQRCTLRFPDGREVKEVPVSPFPETQQVQEIAAYLSAHGYW